MAKKKGTSNATAKIDTGKTVVDNTREEKITNERADNLVNAPAEGKKETEKTVDQNKQLSPIDTPGDARYIPPPSVDDSGSRAHHVRASRGEEVPFYNMPQSGVFNLVNLKA